MATTQFLHLNKPTGSDLVNPLTDTFPNWDLVDTAYHELDSRAIGHATELVSQGVHAITRVDQYAKTFKFIATANYEAGETFTVDGIQVNAYTPSGSALATGSYVSGAVVIASLNADDSAITIYVGGQQTSDNSLRLGGQLPSYYATQLEVDGIDTDVTNLKNLTGNTSIVGIGDGTTTGAISALNTDLNSKLSGIMISLPTTDSEITKTVYTNETAITQNVTVSISLTVNGGPYSVTYVYKNTTLLFQLSSGSNSASVSLAPNDYIKIVKQQNSTGSGSVITGNTVVVN